jgi:geranylgeranyl diphosphate synthase, type II
MMTMTMTPVDKSALAALKTEIKEKAKVIESALDQALPADPGPFGTLAESMRYSLMAGGKRVRPVLCLEAASVTGGSREAAMPFALALEMIHTYTLIHDDLPAMDDDDLRRGRPTNHKVYGEAQALLAGNGLLTYGFEICLDAAKKGLVPHETAVRALHELCGGIGLFGVMGGQSLDIMWEGTSLKIEQVETVCHYKTATLIAASARLGAVVAQASEEQVEALTEYGRAIGLAFQVADDILNVSGDSEKLGKSTGTDEARGKTTFATLLGEEGARKMADELLEKALGELAGFGEKADFLRRLAQYIVLRDR